MAEHLELAATGRARCKVCRQPIDKGALRMGVTEPSPSFDGDMVFWHHALCAALRRPTGLLRAVKAYRQGPAVVREMLKAVASATQDNRLKAVAWQRTDALRCVIEFGGQRFALITDVGCKALVVEGTLDEVLASVPDEDFKAVVAASKSQKPAKKIRSLFLYCDVALAVALVRALV